MLEDEENEARATERLVDTSSGKTVGFLYSWEDGVKQPLWIDGEKPDVIVVEMMKPLTD